MGIENNIENSSEASQMLLRNDTITDWDRMNKINLFTINAFLRLRWKMLDPILSTLKNKTKDTIKESLAVARQSHNSSQ